MTSILAALVLFAFLGHISHTMNLKIEDIPIEGITLAFVAYPALLTQLPGSNLWSILFFLMLITVGLDSVFGSVDYITAFVEQEFPVVRRKYRKSTRVLIVCFLGFLGGLLFCL
jgi:SNF family Na+-dependent transporter